MGQDTLESFDTDTIVAPVSAPGHAGVSIVRLSGPQTRKLIKLCSPIAAKIAKEPRKLFFSPILVDSVELDTALIVFFERPASFTGEDSAEFHLHGSPFLVDSLLKALVNLGARMAAAGEFTQRAFLNGKMDLSQAEAVADLVAAETAAQAKIAKEQLDGRLSRAISELGEPLRGLLAEIEAYIDFPEEDIEPLSYEEWKTELEKTEETIRAYLATFSRGKLYREGAKVSLIGLPNAGKSSLLNRLLGEDRVIVTPIAGTTRDSIEERISLEGLCVRLLDTAGLAAESLSEHQPDEIEKLGIERSWKQVEEADLVLFVLDPQEELVAQKEVFGRVKALSRDLLVILNKLDLLQGAQESKQQELALLLAEDPENMLFVSAKTSEGIELLQKTIQTRLVGEQHLASSPLICNSRHALALENAQKALSRAKNCMNQYLPPELVSIEIRHALSSLNDIVGVTHTEDILGLIFSKFCIGK